MVLAHWKNSQKLDVSLNRRPHYPASSESKSIFFLIRLPCMLDTGVPDTNYVVSSLNRPGIKPTIYLTRGQHVKIPYNLVQNGL